MSAKFWKRLTVGVVVLGASDWSDKSVIEFLDELAAR